eukprot:TRINITY_DN601_c0_g1_i5.p1 TRINITY_DN601_c0_g1~~TRINITY_DN601_c0_g1_i5.p1  ORF type:complete len:351 (+),score=68.08 TRINITY_DN601_c0_g1_i5:56-1108(+)
MLRGFLATVLLVTEVLGAANVGATNKCFFAFRSSEGLHTVPVHGGPVKKLTGTTEITFTSGLAVDGFRGIVLWNEENKIFKINTDGTGKVLLLNAELQKGARMLPKLVHGLTLKTEDHLAFGSIHDDKGGFRVFAFDYLSSNPVMEWSWCHTSTCAVRSTLPVGGSLAAVGDKVFISSGALSQRAHGMGGCSMRWWDSTTSDMLESVIQRNREKDEGMFSGEMGGLVVDEAQSKLYFTESTPSNTNIWVSDLEGTYTSKVLTWLPPHRSWSRRVQGVPSSSIACIGSGTLAVANGTHILKVDLSTPDTFTHVLYSAPSEEEEHVSPIAHYCEGFHTGGRFPTPPPVHDEL